MLSTPIALRSPARWARHALLWTTAVLILVFANPRTADAVEELLSYVTGIECCDSCSCEGCQDGCTDTCAHCICCAHWSAIRAVPFLLPGSPAPQEPQGSWLPERAYASAYREPPFRPPAA